MQPLLRAHSLTPRAADHVGRPATAAESLFATVTKSAFNSMAVRSSVVDFVAPTPGFLVYVEATRLSYLVNEFEPIVFTALDACTHLQVARLYFTGTTASAIDFAEFAFSKFPFPVLQMRTTQEAPFYDTLDLPTRQRFSEFLRNHKVQHSVMSNPLHDDLYPHLSQFTFGRMAAGSLNMISSDELLEGFSSYLLIHNNHRELPALEGRTPLQKLQTFKRFSHLPSFDPFAMPSFNRVTTQLP